MSKLYAITPRTSGGAFRDRREYLLTIYDTDKPRHAKGDPRTRYECVHMARFMNRKLAEIAADRLADAPLEETP